MDKYDIKKDRRDLYAPSSRDFSEVDVPPLHYLAIDGHGDPNTSAEYRAAIEALFPVAYALKFASKAHGRDFVVGPLEGLWWADDPSAFVSRDKSSWDWTMMIVQPSWVTEEMVETAMEQKNVAGLRLLSLDEGRSVQILHLGSYDDETPTLTRLHDQWMPEHGLTFNGHHHEIYLSDARRTAPAKLKTVLRQPVKSLAH